VPRVRIIRSESAPAPVAGAPYNQAVAATPGEMLFVSGQVPVDPATGALVAGDVSAQTEMVLRNLRAVIEDAGGGLDHVVKCTVFLTDLADFPAMNAVYAGAFTSDPPARSTVGVAALPLGARVEIEAIAVLPGG
jgi:2-iminobutanoate/2-iminopropanoate deaminase